MRAGDFDYTVRESSRACHVRLRVSVRDGLVVVVPRGFPVRRVPALLETRRSWIEGALGRVAGERELRERQLAEGPPTHLDLRALGERWAVEYRSTVAKGVSARERGDNTLVVSGDVSDAEATRDALRRWLARRAKATLAPALLGMAEDHDRAVRNVTMRWQRTRWGSCSPTGTISLNTQLLFLSPGVVEYVMVHELCHTARMDHSAEFWALVARHDPHYKTRKRELREGWASVPAWLGSA